MVTGQLELANRNEQDEIENGGPATSAALASPSNEPKKRRARLRPNLPLPAKLKAEKQVKMLRTYVIESKRGTEPADFKKVAQLMEVHPTGVSSAKEFWQDIGALVEASRGLHTPSRAVVAWATAYDFNKTEAKLHLHEIFDGVWIGETVRKAFSVNSAMRRDSLEGILASTTGGEKVETQPRVSLLVDLLIETGYLVLNQAGELQMAAISDSPVPDAGQGPPKSTSTRADDNLGEGAKQIVEPIGGAPPKAVVNRMTLGAVPANVTLSISSEHWPVQDVIRLLKYLRTESDDG